MEPYANLTGFLHVFLWLGLLIYFLTSSDSGSMTDDIISASGLSAGSIPIWQKVFWCFTEGLVAIALVATGGALTSLRHLSLIIGLPYTFLLCLMVPSLYRALKKEAGDEDIKQAKRFNTQLLDFLEFFSAKGSPVAPCAHMCAILKGLIYPFPTMLAVLKKVHPDSPAVAALFALGSQLLYTMWFVLQIVEVEVHDVYVLAWVFFIGHIFIVTTARVELRALYNVYGTPIDDGFASLIMWPFVIAQMGIMVETDGEGAPLYFASADEVIAEMAANADDGANVTRSKTSETADADVTSKI